MQSTLSKLREHLKELYRKLELAEYCMAHTLAPTVAQTDFQENHIAGLKAQIEGTEFAIECHQKTALTTEHALDLLGVNYIISEGGNYCITDQLA